MANISNVFMPNLSIIIPTRNEEAYLPRLLKSIRSQTFSDLEIIVADAHSTDSTIQIAQAEGCRVTESGYPDVGRNNGARASKAPLLFFLDCDTILPHNQFIEQSLQEIQERKLDVAGLLIAPFPTERLRNDLRYRLFYAFNNLGLYLGQFGKKPYMQTGMFVVPQAFHAAGGFPPYVFGEDSALAQAAVSKGYKFGTLSKPGKLLVSPRRLKDKGVFRMLAKCGWWNLRLRYGWKPLRGEAKELYFAELNAPSDSSPNSYSK